MGNQCSGNPDEATSRLVGQPVAVDSHGVEEQLKPGVASNYYDCYLLKRVPDYCYLCLCWPLSLPVFLIIFLGQFLSTCCLPILGNAWCVNPSQITYVHALYVLQHTVKKTVTGWLCCCGCLVGLQPGIMVTTVLLPTPPSFLFDEDADVAYLMTFEEYVAKKKDTFPPYSGKYRAIDGGGNHPQYTFIGQGYRGSAKAEPFTILDPSVMPDPYVMQKELQMRAKGQFGKSPWGQNSLACFFANIAIHEFFRSATGRSSAHTNKIDKPWVNLHSGYLDLQTLYGFNKDLADSIRTFSGGKLKKVAEDRFDKRVPESLIILKLLMWEHNYVCDKLVELYPMEFDTDEKLYQQARLIMGGVFINIVLRQYGDQMFGENAPNGEGFAELRQNFGYWPPFGSSQDVGNHSTITFNLIYRWHTSVPAEWSFANAMAPVQTKKEISDLFGKILQWEAGGFGPNNMPEDFFMRNINVPAEAVRDGRTCGAPRLNDYRRRFNAPYGSFMDMCGDEELAARVAKFYPTIDDVELAVGIQIEKCMAGGWCLPATAGMAIISDAFNSIRQDRFYTTDFKPEIYTEWGFIHAKTTILADLLNRHLDMDIDRDSMISRVPGWKGAPAWSEIEGWPFNLLNINNRGFVPLKKT